MTHERPQDERSVRLGGMRHGYAVSGLGVIVVWTAWTAFTGTGPSSLWQALTPLFVALLLTEAVRQHRLKDTRVFIACIGGSAVLAAFYIWGDLSIVVMACSSRAFLGLKRMPKHSAVALGNHALTPV